MSDRGDIPASALLSLSLDELERIRTEARTDARWHNTQLVWICAVLLTVVVILAATAFSLVVRNNLVILPDRSRKAEPAIKPGAAAAGERSEARGERVGAFNFAEPFRVLDPAELRTWCVSSETPVAVGCAAAAGCNFPRRGSESLNSQLSTFNCALARRA